MRKKYTAIYEKRGKWFVGYIKEIQGVNTQGKTLLEVKKNLKEALYLILEVNRELASQKKIPLKIKQESITAFARE